MDKNSMLLQNPQTLSIERLEKLPDMQPKQETIDFLIEFAAAYHVQKLQGTNVYAEFILN